MRAVSLYAGCGGLDYGFHENGFEIAYACDNNEYAVKCFNHNFEGNVAVNRSVESLEFVDDLENLNNIDIVLGGFPCQGFSKSGPKNKDDSRNTLYLGMVKAIEILRPRFFVAENVDGLAQNYNGELLKKIFSDFEALGYHVKYKILNAVNYGVPQFRRRVIFLGFQNEDDLINHKWPSPTHYGGSRNGEFKLKDENELGLAQELLSATSISEAIGDLVDTPKGTRDHEWKEIPQKQLNIIERIGPGQKLCNVRFAETSVYTWDIPESFGKTTKRERIILETIGKNRRKKIYGSIPNGNPLSVETVNELSKSSFKEEEFETLVKKDYLKKKDGKYDLKGAMFCSGLYKRPKWDEPSPTVITVFDNPRYFVHPIENRPFSIRECARLQSFPDSFEFLSANIPIKEAYRLIGNAVPVGLSRSIANSINTILTPTEEYAA
ncbi:DNA cytosine methyltransferase [Tenacibaculum aiptasiae]|uniref:DNA cytosine methyltransferase n=1 Tax=Tenacibaculum aiptasiae TaxID=426481 RepID=UPI002330303A|nr:DNA cytosine methyltransferase [Tenacibaculum aiptasiae]